MEKNKEIYCSTYCNHGHRLSDGKPIEHECLVIPPKALEAGKVGNFCLAVELIEQSKTKIVKGVRNN